MHRMRLGFYLEETGRTQTDLANEIGRDRKVIWWWINKMDVWVEVNDKMKVRKIEALSKKELYSAMV
jgi:hypothetical protein